MICFTAPDYYYQKQVYSNYDTIENDFLSYIKMKKISYISKDTSICKNMAFFKDPGHLNDFGRYYNTRFFSNAIKKYNLSSNSN